MSYVLTFVGGMAAGVVLLFVVMLSRANIQ